jgi:hypothetical protein
MRRLGHEPGRPHADDPAMDTITTPTSCTRCEEPAVAQLDGDWLCADHALIGLADRIRVGR